ncbi:hypothetical protein ZIOFF_050811 [Zingiber officinale]|uniref:Uncharacterized protein n=1 Tax=Zingiber officinale TaxID=94328 RepID=A0A8J5FHP8_ZINOF|nr:hypothetical protein ZIOFF_050811 [Zingiber officinale]
MDFDWFSSGKGFDCSSWRCFDLLLLFRLKVTAWFAYVTQNCLTVISDVFTLHLLGDRVEEALTELDGCCQNSRLSEPFSLMSSNGFIKASYNLTRFAITVNELTLGLKEKLPPTDSRLRPDQRCLENGEYEMANAEKLRLEQRQRQARKM